jgi:hypothetical protein
VAVGGKIGQVDQEQKNVRMQTRRFAVKNQASLAPGILKAPANRLTQFHCQRFIPAVNGYRPSQLLRLTFAF